MDDEARGQGKSPGQACFAGRATHTGAHQGQGTAGGEQARAGGMMDGPIDTAAAKQGLVGGVDDGVDAELGDIAVKDSDHRGEGCPACPGSSLESPAMEREPSASNPSPFRQVDPGIVIHWVFVLEIASRHGRALAN